MSTTSIKERYDAFQKDAVNAISKDFAKSINGRYLLVIPTGGGKTYTAVKAICAMYDNGTLNHESDKVFWTAHRDELKEQASETFNNFISNNNTKANYENNIIVEMLSKASSIISSDDNIKIVVIDEAHHSAANSYQPIFDRHSLGVLGLTATPSRHDGKPLSYEKESFSIGFPDLVKKGIILRPEIITIEGDEYDITDIGKDSDDLEKLNNERRNNKIINALMGNYEEYSKVIIYVGTVKHVKTLHEALVNSVVV